MISRIGILTVCLGLAGTAVAEEIDWTISLLESDPPSAGIRSANAGVDEATFQWHNALNLASADPCASYFTHRYRSEGNFGDDGSDHLQERGIGI